MWRLRHNLRTRKAQRNETLSTSNFTCRLFTLLEYRDSWRREVLWEIPSVGKAAGRKKDSEMIPPCRLASVCIQSRALRQRRSSGDIFRNSTTDFACHKSRRGEKTQVQNTIHFTQRENFVGKISRQNYTSPSIFSVMLVYTDIGTWIYCKNSTEFPK